MLADDNAKWTCVVYWNWSSSTHSVPQHITCLSRNICNWCHGYGWHSMDASIPRFSGLGFIQVNGAWECECMFVSLKYWSVIKPEQCQSRMYQDKYFILQETTPRLCWIKVEVCIEEAWTLVPADMHFTRPEFVLDCWQKKLVGLGPSISSCKLLLVGPVDAHRAQQATCTIMMETTVEFGLAAQWGR